MNRLAVIGAGPGSAALLTPEAKEALEAADIIWCAARNEDFAPEKKRRSLTPFSKALEEMERALGEGKRAAVLLSGDTGLYSMLPLLKKRFGEKALWVICGVSSVQLLCARLKIDWQDAKIVSAHGRELSAGALCFWARTNPKTILLLDGERNPAWVKAALTAGRLGHLGLWIGEKLSYEDERIAPYEEREYDPLSVALVINENPEPAVQAAGLKDESFIRGKTPMTKREVRMQVLSELGIRPDSVFWDVGAGTGSVSIECARQCPLGEVFAIEREDEALGLIERNKELFHIQNISVIAGSAPEALENLPAPTHVFLGGTGGEAKEILALIERFQRPIRLCATAIALESVSLFAGLLSKYEDFSAYQLSVARVERAGHYFLPKAQNPVYLFSCTIGGGK